MHTLNISYLINRVTLKTEKAKPASRNRALDETKRNRNRRAARELDLPSALSETETEPREVSPSFRKPKLSREFTNN